MDSYVRAAIERELAELGTCPEGGRWRCAFKAAAALGNFVGAGLLDAREAEALLLESAEAAGLGHREALAHVRRGLREGSTTPRCTPTGSPAPAVRRQSVKPKPRTPPEGEAAALWTRCTSVLDCADLARWLPDARGLDPEAVGLWNLARVLPGAGALPNWAVGPHGSWRQSGHVLAFPLFDSLGRLASLRVRRIVSGTDPKELAPRGWPAAGLVFACPLAQQLLTGPPPEWWTPRLVIVAEGSLDFLTWASRQREACEDGPAVFGIYSGAWTPGFGARIPPGSVVALRVHEDAAGDDYARTVAGTLPTTCQLHRAKRKKGAICPR